MSEKLVPGLPSQLHENAFGQTDKAEGLFSLGLVSLGLQHLASASLLQIVEQYIHYYASGSGHTAKAKRYDLQHFMKFLLERTPAKEANDLTVADWTMQMTKDFVEERLSTGESPATVSRRLATLKHLGRTLAERIPGFINPAREVKGPTLQTANPESLSVEELKALYDFSLDLQSCSALFPVVRNSTLLLLLLGTGLRADEVRTLTMGQLDLGAGWLKNVRTKGQKFRNVYLETGLRKVLQLYLHHREIYLQEYLSAFSSLPALERARQPVFISSRGAKTGQPESLGLAPKTLWSAINEIGLKATDSHSSKLCSLHPHRLRHTFAHGLLDSSGDIRLVAQALGHSDVRTTMRYTERSEEAIARAIEQTSSLRQSPLPDAPGKVTTGKDK